MGTDAFSYLLFQAEVGDRHWNLNTGTLALTAKRNYSLSYQDRLKERNINAKEEKFANTILATLKQLKPMWVFP